MPHLIIDLDLCSRCGTCATVCPVKIVTHPDDSAPPLVPEEATVMCLQCGHCESFCPSGALLLNLHQEERVPRPARQEQISPESLGTYLRQRRSIRQFVPEPLPIEAITQALEIARYAPSSGNSQPVHWLVIRDPVQVRSLATLTVDWMRSLIGTEHPLAPYVQGVIGAWDAGMDLICYGAPSVVIAHVPADDEPFSIDAAIALTHLEIVAPSLGLGCCWAGFVSLAVPAWEPLRQAIALPEGRKFGYAMLCGRPQFESVGIPRREPLEVVFR